MKLEEVFKEEMRYINSEPIRRLIIDSNGLVPDYFWEHAASTTGKYHPEISLGKHGLVRHTKLAIWWGVELCRCWPNPYEGMIEEVVASLILHDIQKNGESVDRQGYPTIDNATKVHGVLLAEKIDNITESGDESICRIIKAISGHMGIWTADEFENHKPVNQKDLNTRMLCYIVHMADYCASRKCDTKAKQLSNFELKE